MGSTSRMMTCMIKVGLLHNEEFPLLTHCDCSMARLTMVGEERLCGHDQLLQLGSNRKQVMENYYGTGYGAGSAMRHCSLMYGIHVI